MKTLDWIKLILSIFTCFLAAYVGSVYTMQSIPTWYATLNKPVFNPPNWIFGPVWTLLYLMMAISAFQVWQKYWEAKRNKGLLLFIIQLFLNVFWSVFFFGAQSPLAGLIIIVFLWFAILSTIFAFHKVVKSAAYLLIPYLLWVSFATVLNFSIFVLNL